MNILLIGDIMAAYQTVKELMAAAVEEKGFRPGVVSIVQTFGGQANFSPHAHALVSRGGWSASGEWIPVPYVDEGAAEKLFRHKVLALLRRKGLLTEERIELLLSWRRSGFSVHNRVYVPAGDRLGLEALVRYMMRSPVSLSRLRFTPGSTRGRLLASPAGRGAQRSRRCRFATDGNVLTRRSTFTFPHGTCAQAAVRPSTPVSASR